MITPEYCRLMAQYNAWQNTSLTTAAGGLTDAERRLDRGAFFGSIFETFNHLLWGDTLWMSRFDGGEKPDVPGQESARYMPDWPIYLAARQQMDLRIRRWCDALQPDDLTGDLSWYSGMLQQDMTAQKTLCVATFFNHQTHHRGQVHAMLTAAGAKPDDTDLFLMPPES